MAKINLTVILQADGTYGCVHQGREHNMSENGHRRSLETEDL